MKYRETVLNAPLGALLKAPKAAFPHCTDMLMSAVTSSTKKPFSMYGDYFAFAKDESGETDWPKHGELQKIWRQVGNAKPPVYVWPAPDCIPRYHLGLQGARRTAPPLKRLFAGDAAWLYYLDRMGAFRLLNAVMDDYETVGKYALDSKDPSILILESMTRSRRMGLWSSAEDRESTYLRTLGWPQHSPIRAEPNTAFGKAFFDLIRLVLRYNAERQFASMVGAGPKHFSISAEAVLDLARALYRSFGPFELGRVYVNTLSGLVWCIGGLCLVGHLHLGLNSFGVSKVGSDEFEDYFPALHNALLGLPKDASLNSTLVNHHLNCARHARDILLDVQILGDPAAIIAGAGGPSAPVEQADIANWLQDPAVQGSFEGFASAHRGLPAEGLPDEWKL